MASTTKQSLKPAPAASTKSRSGLAKPAPVISTVSSFDLAQKSTTCQNLTPVDTTNAAKQVDSACDNSGKTNQYYCHSF